MNESTRHLIARLKGTSACVRKHPFEDLVNQVLNLIKEVKAHDQALPPRPDAGEDPFEQFREELGRISAKLDSIAECVAKLLEKQQARAV